MKNKMITITILMAVALAACGTTSTVSPSASTANAKSFSGQAQLIVGIFRLEGTDQAVTAKQASELLPLWEVMKVLASSNTSAQVEVDAALRQIKQTLTPSQLKAITAMKLTQQDVSTFEQGLNTNRVQSSSQNSDSRSTTSEFAPDGGGPGGDSLGGILMGLSQTSTTGTQSTPTPDPASNQIPFSLLDAAIKFLESRAHT